MSDPNDTDRTEPRLRPSSRIRAAAPRAEIEPQPYTDAPGGGQGMPAAALAEQEAASVRPTAETSPEATAFSAPTTDRYASMSAPMESAAGGWKVTAESVRGVSHEKTGMVCQDRHFFLLLPGDVLLAAVADGAGSASKAEIGAETAAHTAVTLLHRAISTGRKPAILWESDEAWDALVKSVFEETRAEVEAEAERQGASSRDLASTLILFMATPEMVAVGQIGDGAVIVSDNENNLAALTLPQSGEYLNETTFLVSPKAVEQAQTFVWRGALSCLAAFSDGLQMLALKMSDSTPHPPFFLPLFRFIAETGNMEEATDQLGAFLRSPRITQRADDDLTLLLAHFAPPAR